jgi:hypothetical protein
MSKLFTFAYTRDPKNIRVYRAYQREYSDFMKYVSKRAIAGRPIDVNHVKNFQKQMDYILKDLKRPDMDK